MNAETIKDFLVSLGFDIDEAGASKFDSVLAGTTANAIKMGLAVEGAALTVVAFTAKIASGLDNLYWASQRTGATVEGIKQIGYAVSQVGGSVDGARGSLENLARFMRNNPGAEGFLNRLGVQTRDASGNMRDMATIFTGVGQRLSSMPYYRANQYAQMLGLDENTLMAMRRGIGQFSGEYTAMAKAIGYNADVAAVSSNKFMTSLRSFGLMAGMARDKIGSSLADGLAGSLDRLRRQILENFPKIEGAITSTVKGILWAGEMVGRVIYRLIQAASDIRAWWIGLDSDTQKLIQTLGGLLVAWRLLNAAMLASPVSWVLALAAAILLLYDDYRTWKEGGKSLIDWKQWEPAIEKAKAAILWLRDKLLGLKDDVGGWQNAFEVLATFVAGSWAARMLLGIAKVGRGFNPILAAMAAISAWDKIGQIQEEAKREGKDVGKYLVDRMNQKQGSTDGLLGGANQALNRLYSWWDSITDTGGATNAYDAYGTVKRPQATKAGAQLLGWMAPMMGKLEAMYNLPAGLLRSVALTESGGNQFAISGAGAQGLFQFMPGTARDMGLRGNDVFDPVKSAEAAARYLSMLLQKNGGDLGKALASYNWGIGNVQKYGMALMPQETRNYIPRVLSNMPGGGGQFQQQNTYNIYGGSAQEIGREVSRQVDEKALALSRNQAGMG
ncbi:lytic transglycosylase domain-containing protein [Klebsiella pneumoniae]|uniref:lytic transglycosylase domain-containing protein n=1 Tax=Klebsiella pneumoniae TaxID=573 RepID=UPI0027306915|nr:lytic transglycosylase domain-containing protein [Klebsiella pneumoniae]MDP1341546.1 lytic transglycosylase domain-containing protein [Klebsiella pneumoniae]